MIGYEEMRVLQINVTYPMGSTGKIVKDNSDELISNGHTSYIIYGRGDGNDENCFKLTTLQYCHVQKIISRLTGLMYGGCFFSTLKLIRMIRKIKPDIVHLHCLNGNFVNIYKLITWLKINNVKTVLTLHAEFMYTANCGHSLDCGKWRLGCGNCPRLKKETRSLFLDKTEKSWKLMKKAFDGFNLLKVVSVSPWLMNRAKESPILSDKKHYVVMNGLNESIFHHYETDDLKRRMGLSNKKVIFHATPSFSDDPSDIKGGIELINIAKRFANDENIVFMVAGPNKCKRVLPPNVISLGNISNQVELAKYYSMSDLTLIVSKKETFSMVVAESLCCGTPVIGFLSGGPESIAIPEYSLFFEYGNIDLLYDAIKNYLYGNISVDSNKAISIYSKKAMYLKYYKLYCELIENNYMEGYDGA